jgi:hypothetical protein
LGQIDSLVDKHWDAFIGDEEKSPPLDEMGGKTRYMDIGVVRGLLYLERPDIREKYQFKGVIGRVMRRAKKKQRRGTNTKKDDDALG